MDQTWHSLYLPTNEPEPVAGALRRLLDAQGYQPYDPFPGGTGTPSGLREMIRLFVAPPYEGWVRVLGQPPENLLAELSRESGQPLIYGWLSAEGGGFTVFEEGVQHNDPSALAPYLRPEATPDLLAQAFAGDLPVPPVEGDSPPAAVIGAEGVPPEIRQLAQAKGVSLRQADRLAKKMSRKLLGRGGRKSSSESETEQEAARALLADSGFDLWNSLPGQRLRAVANLLHLPGNWRLPSFETVRDAYQVHRLRQRSPRMPLMPGDKQALEALPDALSYLPVYMAKA